MFQGLIFAVVSAACFGSMAILVKLGYAAGMSGPVMMQFRFSFGTLLLFFYLLAKDRTLLRISLRDLAKCAFLGMVAYWTQTTCFVAALETIPASTTALVLYGHPMVVTLLSGLFLKMPVNRTMLLSLGLVMTGCCLVFYDAFLRAVDPTGLAYALGAMATFSVYLILMQVLLKNIRPLKATFYIMLGAAVSFTLSGDVTAWMRLDGGQQTAIALALGLIPGVMAVAFLYTAIEKIGSAYACIFSSVEPIITLSAAAAFLGEQVVWLQMGGAGLIIFGIVVPNLRRRRPQLA
ncbi:MAG: DMT family transporter [Pseudodesulfovibrio sp.]|uniref:DMT family transporter n=1 Tax=Pseudodesulfovibrio sp. TaxID=2035812 RepID=UPI003D0F1ED5